MKRLAKEKAYEKMFYMTLQNARCTSWKQYLEKQGIPYSLWPKRRTLYPEEPCMVISHDETHAAYFDGHYLWNPNDNRDTPDPPIHEDGLDTWIKPRGFRDFQEGIKISHNEDSVGDGVCFMVSLGYHTVLSPHLGDTDIDESRQTLLRLHYREMISKKVS
jgi:hypothetical protein